MDERLEKIEDERQKVLEQARAEGELEVELLKAQLKLLKDELKKAHQPLDVLRELEEKVEEIEEKVQKPVIRRQKATGSRSRLVSRGPLKEGDKVLLRTLGTEGVISSIDGEAAEIQAGPLRMRVKLDELKRKDEEPSGNGDQPSTKKRLAESSSSSDERHLPLLPASPGIELDLRGQRAEDALEMLDRYLEKATMAGLPFVRIIHGKGTGKLRQEVRTMLKGHPHVTSFEEGGDKEGGAGVTVVKLVSG